MIYQFRSLTLFNCFFTSQSENLQDSCNKLSKYSDLHSMHDELNFMITSHLFLCLCQQYNYIFYLFDKTSTVFVECFSETDYTSNLSDLWEVLFKISFCAVTKSTNWCLKFHHCWDKIDSHNKSWVFSNSYSTKKVFKHD